MPFTVLALFDIRPRMTAILLAFLMGGCASENHPRHMNQSLGLSQRELSYAVGDATKGDPAAAWRLFLHYDAYAVDPIAAEKWLRAAAKLGHPQAIALLPKWRRPAQ